MTDRESKINDAMICFFHVSLSVSVLMSGLCLCQCDGVAQLVEHLTQDPKD